MVNRVIFSIRPFVKRAGAYWAARPRVSPYKDAEDREVVVSFLFFGR
jgi:hypothetical protein